MKQHMFHKETATITGIARSASFYDWLVGRSRPRRRPAPPPAYLYADLGLPSPGEDRDGRGGPPFD